MYIWCCRRFFLLGVGILLKVQFGFFWKITPPNKRSGFPRQCTTNLIGNAFAVHRSWMWPRRLTRMTGRTDLQNVWIQYQPDQTNLQLLDNSIPPGSHGQHSLCQNPYNSRSTTMRNPVATPLQHVHVRFLIYWLSSFLDHSNRKLDEELRYDPA